MMIGLGVDLFGLAGGGLLLSDLTGGLGRLVGCDERLLFVVERAEVGSSPGCVRFEILTLLLEFGELGLEAVRFALAALDRGATGAQLATDLRCLPGRHRNAVPPLRLERRTVTGKRGFLLGEPLDIGAEFVELIRDRFEVGTAPGRFGLHVGDDRSIGKGRTVTIDAAESFGEHRREPSPALVHRFQADERVAEIVAAVVSERSFVG